MPTKKTVKTKPQLKNLDDLFALDGEEASGKLKIQDIPLDKFTFFPGHPFRLQEGERLDDMAESIKANGVLVPVIARKPSNGADTFELLAGYHRHKGSEMAGKDTVPTIVLENISDEEAMIYVIETNLMQRSFTDMSHSEKAKVITMHHSKMFSQGKRNDILEQLKAIENPDAPKVKVHKLKIAEKSTASTSPHSGTRLGTAQRTDEKIGAMYSLARNTIARYLRVDKLVHELKVLLDDGAIPFLAAVEISFLRDHEQHWLVGCLKDGYSINVNKAAALREQSKVKALDADTMKDILAGNKAAATENKPRKVKISGEFYGKYFTPEQSAQDVESIVEEALTLFFSSKGAVG